MPEISEIKLTTDFLNSSLKDKKIINWLFIGGKYPDEYPEPNDYPDICDGSLNYLIEKELMEKELIKKKPLHTD